MLMILWITEETLEVAKKNKKKGVCGTVARTNTKEEENLQENTIVWNQKIQNQINSITRSNLPTAQGVERGDMVLCFFFYPYYIFKHTKLNAMSMGNGIA